MNSARASGHARDLVNGPIASTLLAFSIPTLGSSILQSVNGSINAIWIGHFLGKAALAATANANLISFLAVAAVFGIGMTAAILVAQNVGRRDLIEARRAFGTTIGLFLLLSTLCCVLGWIYTPQMLHALSTPTDVYPLALSYLHVIFIGLPPGFLTIVIGMALRGTGDSVTPLWFMTLGAVVDVALNPVFILGLGPAPRLGIAGSALATMIANYVALIGLMIFIYVRDLPIRLRGAELRFLMPAWGITRTLFQKGIPMGLQVLVVSLSGLAMIGLVNRGGSTTSAAYGATSQLWTYIQMPAMSVGGAVSSMVAQNIGAGRWDRVDRITWAGIKLNMALTGGLILLLAILDRAVLSLFLGSDQAAIDLASHINLVVSWSFAMFGVGVVLSATSRANGAVLVPLVILATTMFPLRFGAAIAAYPYLGSEAIWWSYPFSGALSVIMQILYYRYGGWRKMKLIEPEQTAVSPVGPAESSIPLNSAPSS